MDDRLLKKRKYMYWDWLYNWRPEKTCKKKASKLGQKWTSQLEEIIEKTGARPGSKTFIERYQSTLTAVMASLSTEQLEEAQNTVIKSSGKTNFAKKKALGTMKDLATKLWKHTSMKIFILSAWKTEEGEVRINGTEWKPMLSEWNTYAGEEFIKYLSHMGVISEVDLNDDDDDNEGEVKKTRKKGGKKDNYPLEVDTYGLPVIPEVEDLSLESKKCLIRTFLTKHYIHSWRRWFLLKDFRASGKLVIESTAVFTSVTPKSIPIRLIVLYTSINLRGMVSLVFPIWDKHCGTMPNLFPAHLGHNFVRIPVGFLGDMGGIRGPLGQFFGILGGYSRDY
ncbi:hypothetical protein EV702DRAFT_1046310 [Suillus placidus]|uniref:Uncharacterized protein n=1 Tax=Suillus placidus TaxID=48579 RepID=A0A9P6ZSV9_9AGAM|nr:hypothetical protein EV702DRAFT_1046310 [Suillus placidus]